MTARTMEARAIITAQDKTGRAFQQVAGKMRHLTGQARAMNTSLAAGQATFLAGAARFAGPAALALGVRKAAGESLSFERQMYQVERATNVTGEASEEAARKILDLSRATGKSKEELAQIYAAAGFAGRPIQDLARYTEYAAKATVAWGTDSEETGQALAEIGNIYQASQNRIEEIGDAINYVADQSASSEKDLLGFIRRSGAAGKQAGLSAEQTLAFGAAYKEVGVQTEVASTSFNTFVNAMALGDKFLDKSKEGYHALGLSAAKVQKEFAKKPVYTMVKMLERLAKVTDPIKRAEVMTNLFGKEHQDDIGFLLNNLPRLNELLGQVGNKGNYAGGVMGGFAAATEKNFNKLERAAASIDVLWTRVGNKITLVAGAVADKINQAVDAAENAAPTPKGAMLNPESQAKVNRWMNKLWYDNAQPSAFGQIEGAHWAKADRDRIDQVLAGIDRKIVEADNEGRSAASGINGHYFRMMADRKILGFQGQRDGIIGARDGMDATNATLTDVWAQRRALWQIDQRWNGVPAAPPPTGSGLTSFRATKSGLPVSAEGGAAKSGSFPVSVEGEALVRNETTIRVLPGSELIRIEEEIKELVSEVRTVLRQANGRGSTGTSSPDVGSSFKFNSNGPR